MSMTIKQGEAQREDAERQRFVSEVQKNKAQRKQAIVDAKVPGEKAMRDSKAPTPDTIEELAEYVRTLVERPHDYGTCCYAMSLSATAAFNFVAHKLGVTGFQASCADLDILRRTRGFEWGRILNYNDLLYPQYREKWPSFDALIRDPEIRSELAKRARELLKESTTKFASKQVLAHWKMLADWNE